jgi:hypothetical protein
MIRSQERTRLSDKSPTTSMPVLPEAIWPRSAHSHPAEILFRARVSGGEQAAENRGRVDAEVVRAAERIGSVRCIYGNQEAEMTIVASKLEGRAVRQQHWQ